MKKTIISLIICAASVVLAYGKPIQIKGYIAVGLWLILIVFMILLAKKTAGGLRAAFILLLVCFLISSGLFYMRDFYGIMYVHTEQSGSCIVEYCDINPGAFGHAQCRRTEYYNVLESRALTIRIPKSVKFINDTYYPGSL